MADNQQHIIPTAELIRQYLEGKLDGKTMHALEKQALEDPFLADALEGYAQYPANQQSALSELQQRLQQRVGEPASKKVRRLDYRWLAAASVLVILCITAVMILNRPEKEIRNIAQVSPVAADSAEVPQIADSNQAADVAQNNATTFKADKPAASAGRTEPALAKTPAAEEKTDAAKKGEIAPASANTPVVAESKEAQPTEKKKQEVLALQQVAVAERSKQQAQPAFQTQAAADGNIQNTFQRPLASRKVSKPETAASGNLIIRGNSTITKESAPLVLKDGKPVSMDSINPNEIASIKILKDASAQALYGARAANGVLVVTTKEADLLAKQAAPAPPMRFGSKGKFGDTLSAWSALAYNGKIDTIHIGGVDKEKWLGGKLDSKVEGLVTGAKSNFSNYYTDDNVHKISGVVVDEKTGKKLPGVYVSVNGTNRGAVTDTAGNFALHIASKSKAELEFSSLGYVKKNVTISPSTNNLNVALPARTDGLNDVVVVGYGKEKKQLFPPFPVAGDEAFSVYLVTNKTVEIPGLKTPLTGSVHISFTVMPDGDLRDFKVLQGMGKAADSAAIQNIKNGPKWMPASNQKKATVEVTVPIELVKKGPPSNE